MKSLIYVFFVLIVTIGITGFLMFNSNDEKSLNDLKKESQFLMERNEYEKAIKFFDIILKLDPTDNYIIESRGIAIQKINANSSIHDATEKNARDIISNTFSEPLISLKLPHATKSSITNEIIEANKLYQEKKYSEALYLYNVVLLDDTSNVYALNGKGGTLLSLKQFDDSIETFEYVIHLYPENTNALNGKAYAYYLKAISMKLPGLFYDSVHTYQNTLKIDSKNINALVGIASALDALERYDEAIDHYNEVLSIDPDNQNARNGLFDLWIKLGNREAHLFYFDSAIVYFNKVLELDPKNPRALLAMAASYAEWGKSKEKYYDISENIYTEILEYYPNNTSALVGKGYVLSEQLKFEKSLEIYEKSLEIDPNNINAQAGKEFVSKRISDD